MELQQLKTLIATGESETLEFKKSTTQLKAAAESLCAFLNTQGGRVLLGVKNDGDLVGQDVSDATRLEIANILSKFEPTGAVDVDYIEIKNEKYVVCLHASANKISQPYVFDGKPFLRLESSTQKMPQSYYQQLLQGRSESNHSWDALPATGISINDLDQEEIIKTVKHGIAAGRLSPLSDTEDPQAVLLGLNLMGHDLKLANAAAILFGHKHELHYPQCKLRLAYFRGNDRKEFIDSKQITGHLFHLLDAAFGFIERHLPVSSTFDKEKFSKGDLRRTEQPALPPTAIREALINAFIHRDYSFRGGAVSIAIFAERLEIWSDGGLPYGVAISDLSQVHPSKPRNELIAKVMYRRDMFEEWGRGTLEMIRLCEESGLPTPEFSQVSGSVCVCFSWGAEQAEQPQKEQDLTWLSKRQKLILQLLTENEALSLKQIVGKLPDSPHERLIRDDLYALKGKNKISNRGHGRGAVWYLIDSKG